MNPSRNERVSGLLLWLLLLFGGLSTWRAAYGTVVQQGGLTVGAWAPSLAAITAAVVVPLVFLVGGFTWLKAPASIGIQRLMVLLLLTYHGVWFGLGLRDKRPPAPINPAVLQRPAAVSVPAGPDFVAINRNLAVVSTRLKQRQSRLKRLELSLGPHWNLQQLTASATAAVSQTPWSKRGLAGTWDAAAVANEKRGDVTVALGLKVELQTDTFALIRWAAQLQPHRAKFPAIARFDEVTSVDDVMAAVRRSQEDFRRLEPGLKLNIGQDTLRFQMNDPRQATKGKLRFTESVIDVVFDLEVQLLPSEFAIGVALVREKLHQYELQTPASLRRLESEAVELLSTTLAGFELVER